LSINLQTIKNKIEGIKIITFYCIKTPKMSICLELEQRVKDEVKDLFEMNDYKTRDEFEEAIEEEFNNKTFTDRYIDYEYYIPDCKTMFYMIKYIVTHFRENYGFEYNFESFELTVNCYAYLTAKEYMTRYTVYLPEEIENDPDEDYNHHNDEDDVELCQ